MRYALMSVLHLFAFFSFVAGGSAFMALAFEPVARLKIADFLLIHPEKCAIVGIILLSAALVMFIGFYTLERGRFLVIQMGVSIDPNLVRQAVEECFRHQFGREIALVDLTVSRQSKLEVQISTSEENEELLARIEKELSSLFSVRFGYAKPFDLVVRK